MKKVTLKDIADQLNLSQNTISVALRGNSGINEETRRKILNTARDMGYINKKIKEDFNILLVTTINTTADTYFFHHLLTVMQQEVFKRNSSLFIINTSELQSIYSSFEELLNYISEKKIKGILILGDIDKNSCKLLIETGLSIVGTSFYLPGANFSSVVEDNISGAFSVVNYLFDQGYRKIGFIGETTNISFLERFYTYKVALESFDLNFDENICITDILEEYNSDYKYITERLKVLPELPEAFICSNDKMAALTIKALDSMGFCVPDDIGIIGFDNNEIAQLSIPTITSVDTKRDLQGITAVGLLWDLIQEPGIHNKRIVLPVELIIGESTKKKF